MKIWMCAVSVAAASLVVASGATTARADILYNESGQGDLSNNHLAPTVLAIAPGSSQFFGVMTGPGVNDVPDRDYFTITIPAGYVLSSITLDLYESVDFAAFLGVVAGANVPFAPDDALPSDMLGFVLPSSDQVGSDLLPIMGAAGIGFAPPLGAGTYTFWAQQLDDFTEYALTFAVTPVPTPGAAGVFALGALCAAKRRRR